MQSEFKFQGEIQASKSLFNRALVVKSFFPELELAGQSSCLDVKYMQEAIQNFPKSEIFCGDAGTVLRFMALRVSREKGKFRLRGSRRLFERPQQDLLFVLSQLGVRAELLPDELIVDSEGWKKPLVPVRIHREKSSQFATGLLFSTWSLPFTLEFELTPVGLYDPYWLLSLQYAEMLGMKIDKKNKDQFVIPANQKIFVNNVSIEPDYSSAFSIAAAAALCGEATIENFGENSMQPDFLFTKFLKDLTVPVEFKQNALYIKKPTFMKPIKAIIRDNPDLFPVLSILCAFASGESQLTGAPRLAFKESNRIKKTSELLSLMRIENEISEDGIKIQGKGMLQKTSTFDFDPDQDHRMAMAAGILLKLGWKINLKNPQVVSKSFPEFWSYLGINL